MKKVIAFGTFDILHPGHVRFLQAAARLGELTIALTSDDGCQRYKGTRPMNNYDERARRLNMLTHVAKVVPADDEPGLFTVFSEQQYDVAVLGYDQSELGDSLLGWRGKTKSKIAISKERAYRPDLYKSSKLRRGNDLQ